MFTSIRSFLVLSVFVLVALTNTSNATDGYFRHGYGVKYSALAGSGVAVSLSSLGAISNPAGLAFINGSRYDFNLSLFSPLRDYTIEGQPSGFQGTFGLVEESVESESKLFFFPTFGGSWKINANMALGLAVYGNGGMNTDYATRVFFDPNSPDAGVNLEQLFGAATYSIELYKNHALGVSAIFGWQRFAAKGLLAFSNFSSDPANLTGNAFSTSTGFGGKIGYQGQFGEILRVGASYQSKIYMSEFDRYKGLFAEEGDFDVPATWSFGIAVMPNSQWTILLDFQQIMYSDINSVGNPMDLKTNFPAFQDGTPNPNFNALGTAGGWGFGWEDMEIIKFGLMTKLPDDWTIMAGYSYGTQPIPESEVLFNILAPGVVQHHITAGFTKLINKNNELNFAFMYAPNVTVTGANPLEVPNAQTIGIRMSQFQVDIGYAFSSL